MSRAGELTDGESRAHARGRVMCHRDVFTNKAKDLRQHSASEPARRAQQREVLGIRGRASGPFRTRRSRTSSCAPPEMLSIGGRALPEVLLELGKAGQNAFGVWP